jgi:hypothetical protein
MQSLCATAILSSEMVPAMADGYWSEIWEEWFRPLSKDALKTLSILAIMYVFWETIVLMRLRGYPEAYLQPFEKTHFVFMWVLYVVTGGNFILKQLVGLWPKRRRRR